MRTQSASRSAVKSVKLGAALVAVTVITACGGSTTEPTKKAGAPATAGEPAKAESAGPDQEITVAVQSEPLDLDPQKYDDASTLAVTLGLNDALYDLDNGVLTPTLAEGEPRQINDTTFEVDLKKGIKFTDGHELNADDVVYSFNRAIVPEYGSAWDEIGNMKGATKVDEDTVRIETVTPDPLLPRRLSGVRIIADGDEDFEESNGTGPYRLVSHSANESVLEYNPDYWGPKPQVTKITVKVIPDPASRLAALKSGEVDIIAGLSPDDFGQVPKVIASKEGAYNTYVRVNSRKPPFNDVRLRRAVNHAVNVKEITDKLFEGSTYAEPLPCQPGPANLEGASKTLQPYPYDPEKARQLTEQAGAVGKRVTLNWVTGGSFPLDRDVGQLVAQQIEQNTGLKVDLKLLDYAGWVETIRTVGDEAADLNFIVVINPMGSVQGTAAMFYPPDGRLGAAPKDEKMAKLFAKAAVSFEPERQQAMEEMLTYGCEQAPLLYLYSYKSMLGTSKRISLDWESENRPKYTRVTVHKVADE